MRIVVVSISHRTAPVELREQLALSGAALDAALDELRVRYPQAECVVLATCNRTEVYLSRPSHEPPSAEDVCGWLAEMGGAAASAVLAASVTRENDQAVAHLFRVCAGLESMVLGEPQILGQVRRAYARAVSRRAVGPVLHRVFQQALATGKEVRAATGIDAGRLSVGSIAVDFAREIFESFQDKVVVAVGAGDVAKLTLRHLQALKPARLWLVNRSQERAAALAERLGLEAQRGGARPWDALDELLVAADIVLTSTAAPQPILSSQRVKPLLKRRRFRPLFIIDLAVPRDVEAEVGALPNVYLYNIDDLQRVARTTLAGRCQEMAQAEALLHAAVGACFAQVQHQDVGQVIRALRERLHELGRLERQRTLNKVGATPAHELPQALPELLEEHTHRLVNKILHLPLSQLDSRRCDAPLGFYAAALRRLFALQDQADEKPGDSAEPPPSAPPEA